MISPLHWGRYDYERGRSRVYLNDGKMNFADATQAAGLREDGLAIKGVGDVNEPGRAGKEHVVERLGARLRRVECDRELLLDALLADEVVEPARPERALGLLFLRSER